MVDAPNGVMGVPQQAGGAKGFGIQITKSDGSIMPFQVRVLMGGVVANVTSNYGFNAQYRKVAAVVSPGVVSAGLVLTMDYQ
jgi:type 1 fimbria pilin